MTLYCSILFCFNLAEILCQHCIFFSLFFCHPSDVFARIYVIKIRESEFESFVFFILPIGFLTSVVKDLFFVYFFGGLECVGHSFAYVAHF
jgi:hypothetical protein